MRALHIIEPTLSDESGHCHGYVQSLLAANQQFEFNIHVWLDRRGKSLYPDQPCRLHPYFSKRIRQIQKIFCLRQLLKKNEIIFIPTAGRVDCVFLDRLLRFTQHASTASIFLHFHQFTVTEKKRQLLTKIAKEHPKWVIMAPTLALLTIFRECGFSNCELVPCPSYAPTANLVHLPDEPVRVIYAGAARRDKGFPAAVAVAEYAAKEYPSLPFVFQVSPPASGRYDEASKNALLRLHQEQLKNITCYQQTLNQSQYHQLFQNAIALLIYEKKNYHDKFSGVALDAFYSGTPVITTGGTWAAQMTERFQAGIVVPDSSPQTVLEALQQVLKNMVSYRRGAMAAGKSLKELHDPANTLRVIDQYWKKGQS